MTADLAAIPPQRQRLVVVESHDAGHASAGLQQAYEAMQAAGFTVLARLPVSELATLGDWLAHPASERPLVVAAGGDGTVSAVLEHVANRDAILGILPLGTSNDVARSLGLPLDITEAVHLLGKGDIVDIDLGMFESAAGPPRYFIQAATMGIHVEFSKLATQVSLRKRLGRFTYLVAAALAFRRRRPFSCSLAVADRRISMRVIHLSILNAPIFGGMLGLRLADTSIADGYLDLLAIEAMSPAGLMAALASLLLRAEPHLHGMRVLQARQIHVSRKSPLDVSLDGEVAGRIPGVFTVVPGALHVVSTPTSADSGGQQ